MLGRVLPDVDVGRCRCTACRAAARWSTRSRGAVSAAGADDRVFVARRGRLRRETDIVPHEKVQSARLTQGPLQRRLGLATVHLDTTPGPVSRPPPTGTRRGPRLLDAEVERARQARASARTGTVDEPPEPPRRPTVPR